MPIFQNKNFQSERGLSLILKNKMHNYRINDDVYIVSVIYSMTYLYRTVDLCLEKCFDCVAIFLQFSSTRTLLYYFWHVVMLAVNVFLTVIVNSAFPHMHVCTWRRQEVAQLRQLLSSKKGRSNKVNYFIDHNRILHSDPNYIALITTSHVRRTATKQFCCARFIDDCKRLMATVDTPRVITEQTDVCTAIVDWHHHPYQQCHQQQWVAFCSTDDQLARISIDIIVIYVDTRRVCKSISYYTYVKAPQVHII